MSGLWVYSGRGKGRRWRGWEGEEKDGEKEGGKEGGREGGREGKNSSISRIDNKKADLQKLISLYYHGLGT